MYATRTAELISRMPRWFATQARAAQRREQERQRQAEAHAALNFLCGVDVRESSFDEWQDTVASFTAVTMGSCQAKAKG
jgi:hypothetical protein